ncbi:MAG: hypothetical protein J6S75_04410 [Thermoguttaceae bacterium]|nr:hypothetical protein [Thermoguttaceae bacterium]
MILFNGQKYAWTIPLSIPVTEEMASSIKVGEEVALVNGAGRPVALLSVTEVFPWEKGR